MDGSLAGLRVNLARGVNLLVGSNRMVQGCSTKLGSCTKYTP